MNVVEKASRTSVRELPLSVIKGQFLIAPSGFFTDGREAFACLGRKFNDLEQIEKMLVGRKVYLYKLYELTKYDFDGEPCGTYYNLRYCFKK